ncbi:MAG: PhnE/PtxC family ABC transporter permease [Cyanobacteriota bacterium]|jgi:phosphonate transport system permease protein
MADSSAPLSGAQGRWKPAPPLLLLMPALVVPPLLLALPGQVHAGGLDLIARFLLAALRPSLDPLIWRSALDGLAVTLGMALLGWTTSLLGGLVLGCASSRTLWRVASGQVWPAMALRRLLAIPRSLHELLWGLLLLQLLGLRPVVAVVAIALPYSALVARLVADLLDGLDTSRLEALRCAGASAPAALLTALGPALLPGLLSYGGYRLECALRSATLLGVFGLGGLGTELRLTLQSLEFGELWVGLWLLFAAMLLLERSLAALRRRWLAPRRLRLAQPGNDKTRPLVAGGRELALAVMILPVLCWLVAGALGVRLADLTTVQPLPPLGPPQWGQALALPWPSLIANTLALTLLAAALAVGLAPLLLLVVAPWPWAQALVRSGWALGRLWPPPLTALLLLFVLRPGLLTAALALGFHNLGILGRLLLEGIEEAPAGPREALLLMGGGPRWSLLYASFSAVARSYLAYGAYRADVILRETVVVGLMGATGLGSQLLESLSAFAWERILVLVAVYGALTLLGEELSDRLRRRWLALPSPPAGKDAQASTTLASSTPSLS